MPGEYVLPSVEFKVPRLFHHVDASVISQAVPQPKRYEVQHVLLNNTPYYLYLLGWFDVFDSFDKPYKAVRLPLPTVPQSLDIRMVRLMGTGGYVILEPETDFTVFDNKFSVNPVLAAKYSLGYEIQVSGMVESWEGRFRRVIMSDGEEGEELD